jgi:hypothetical protein
MKQKVRILLTSEALMMATKLQTKEIKPLSQIIEDCVRRTYAQEAERIQSNDT